jgi:Beige/BEACH domain/PH domain associated with Beige/BEACH
MQQEYETEYFWRKTRLASRGRFNLLLLEYGEIFYENLSVFQYPVPNHNLKFAECDSLKVKGRLHVCSRSIIFEPSDIKRPLLKFPYRTITSELETFRLKPEEILQCSVTASGFATFRCSSYFELKGNDQIGPYKLVDCSSSQNHDDSETSFVFALVHTDSSAFFSTVRRLRDEITGNCEGGGLISLRSQHLPQNSSKAVSFDSSQLVDFHEQLLFPEPIGCVRVGPLVLHPGCLMVTGSRIYFQPSNLNNIGDSVQHFNVSKIKRVFSRRYLLRQTGVEIFFTDSGAISDVSKNLSSVYFVFESTEVRDRVVSAIESLASFPAEVGIQQKSIHSMTQKWQQKKVSNFDYLLFLNSEADRSFSDLTQYPIMPHVICDYQSRKLDLTKPETFRDLTKPIGALNPQRLAFFKERYQSMSSVATEASASGAPSFPPPFLYGTHYSTPGYVLYYLVRVAPEHMLCLQNGKFDAADRMFYSVAGMFTSCLSNPADLKELIPEFFHGEGEFLSNNESLNLGRRHNGERVDDVELPPWAKSPKDFVKKSRQALESDYVSDRLHHWIDLIFGYKQRGEEALLADNLFYHMTYEGALDLESDLSPGLHCSQRTQGQNRKMMEREAIDVQIQEFGQTPKQLFSSPHPRRGDASAVHVLLKTPEAAVAVARQVQGESAGIAVVKAAVSEVMSKQKDEAHQQQHHIMVASPQKMKVKAVDATKPAAPILPTSVGTSGSRVVEPLHVVRADSATPVKSTRMTNGQDKTVGGMILLGEDFRAEVTRQLQAQHAAGMTEEPSYESSGALVVKPRENASIGKSWSEDTGTRNTHQQSTPGSSPAMRSNQNQASPPYDRDSAVSAQVWMQTPTQAKSTMQSLWGTFTEKTISMIRPDKGLGSGLGLGLGLVASPGKAVQSQSPVATESLATPEREKDKVSPSIVRDGSRVLKSIGEGSEARRGAPTDPSAKVTAQLCCLKPLPRKVPISDISALQVSSNDGKCRIIICATARDATVSVYLSDILRSKTESEPAAPTADDEGWKSIGESPRKEDQRDAAFTALDLISSFTAGAVSSPAATIFRPLGLLPQMLSTAFSLQPLCPPYNSSCRLSTDATRVLISSQRGLDCALYR